MSRAFGISRQVKDFQQPGGQSHSRNNQQPNNLQQRVGQQSVISQKPNTLREPTGQEPSISHEPDSTQRPSKDQGKRTQQPYKALHNPAAVDEDSSVIPRNTSEASRIPDLGSWEDNHKEPMEACILPVLPQLNCQRSTPLDCPSGRQQTRNSQQPDHLQHPKSWQRVSTQHPVIAAQNALAFEPEVEQTSGAADKHTSLTQSARPSANGIVLNTPGQGSMPPGSTTIQTRKRLRSSNRDLRNTKIIFRTLEADDDSGDGDYFPSANDEVEPWDDDLFPMRGKRRTISKAVGMTNQMKIIRTLKI